MFHPSDLVAPLLVSLQHVSLPDDLRELSPTPSESQIECILEAAFCASMLLEEARSVRVALIWLNQLAASKRGDGPAPFESPLTLTPESIRRLAPAVTRDGGYLAIGPNESGVPVIWGLLHISFNAGKRPNPPALVIEILRPGSLLVSHVARDLMLLNAGKLLVFDQQSSAQDFDFLRAVTELLGSYAPPPSFEAHCLVRVALNVMHHSHGGALLVAPRAKTLADVQCIKTRFAFQESGQTILSDEMERFRTAAQGRAAGEVLTGAERFVAQLTGVDGAVLLLSGLRLGGFGVFIEPYAVESEPHFRIGNESPKPISQIGGTRHQSAARFCWKNPGAIALVASQDGGLKLLSKLPSDEIIQVKGPFGEAYSLATSPA